MAIENTNIYKFDNGFIYEELKLYLKEVGYKSKHTMSSYKLCIERFFQIVKKKNVAFATVEDVQITLTDLQIFIGTLKDYIDDKGNKLNNKTINTHITAIAEFLRYLHQKEVVEDLRCISNLKRLRLKEIDNEHGILEVYELFNFLTFIEENEENLKLEKFMFVVLSADTMLRKSAILNLKWSNFEVRKDSVIIRAVDKGSKDFRKQISHETYNKLLKLKRDNTDKVFNIATSTLQGTLNRFKVFFNIPESRRIVIHSIRKCAAEELYAETNGDIMAVRNALGHTHINTSQKYLNKDKSSMMGMFSRGLKYNKDLYKEETVSHQMLIDAIDKLSDREKLLINKQIEIRMKDKD